MRNLTRERIFGLPWYFWLAAKYRHYSMMPRTGFVRNLAIGSIAGPVTGCVVECGVWKGGMVAALAEILGPNREYFLFDSWEGLPKAQAIDGPRAQAWQADRTSIAFHDNCRADEADARNAMSRCGAQRVHYMKGWFSTTLPGFTPPRPIALLRIDADWYESTKIALDRLWQFVAPGGVVVFDDYYTWDGCAIAVHEFLLHASHANTPPRLQTYGAVAYIVKA